jgi:hypothetical protein
MDPQVLTVSAIHNGAFSRMIKSVMRSVTVGPDQQRPPKRRRNAQLNTRCTTAEKNLEEGIDRCSGENLAPVLGMNGPSRGPISPPGR